MSLERSAIHPGEYLREELICRGMSIEDAADALGWTPLGLVFFLDGKISVDESAANAIARLLGTSPEVWLNLQRAFDSDDFAFFWAGSPFRREERRAQRRPAH